MIIRKLFKFEGAHIVRDCSSDRCKFSIHGHSYVVEVFLTSDKLDRVPNLLNMLASEGHHTPFEKSQLHFLVTVDQATHIHLLKHRIAVSINGESARYKELKEDKTYLPEDWGISRYRMVENFMKKIHLMMPYSLLAGNG